MTADPCLMPVAGGHLCQLPGDHDGGCHPLRVVHEHAPTVGSHFCLHWVGEGERKSLCCLWPGHDGTCLALPRFPRTVEEAA